ncbi:DNA-directed RNA polymerase I subunit RPA43 [Melipona quadrifasciata]|uniref:DNA-directed RNA polymerase I subunit RPA43 n=1 Tax=Melipona quadrifasciata TaxID=166423 RepID=A0A0M8ZSW5_9HYME|nr:DNA-directed RNA polymerase I subunit RPA43 [Melipona quadrifasciata]
MRFRTDSGITWSSLELAGLVEDEESRVYFEKFKKHFGLHPFHLTNLNAALNEILSSNLNSYDPELCLLSLMLDIFFSLYLQSYVYCSLKGFLLAYRNPKLVTSLGEIFYDTCFIHVDVETEFYVFRPEVGFKLKGVVNKKGLDHIGILVHKAFNVSIPKPNDEEDWPGDNVEIGQEVRFTITLLDFNSKLPFIRGVLNSNDYLHGCKLMLKSINNKRLTSKNNICSNSSNNVSKKNVEHGGKHTFFTTDSEDTDEDIPKVNKEIEPKVSEKKKKAKKRDKKFNEINESKTKLINVESEYDHHANNISLNGELMSNEESELSDPKSKIEKKFKIKSSPSWVNENNETFVDNSPRSYLKVENDTSKIKVEYNRSDNESILEDKSMIKKKPMKRRSDSTSKKDSKKIKVEQFDDTCEYICDDAQESPTKQYKKHKESLQLETFESEETATKKHTKKCNISDSQVVFENVKIKKERLTSGSENSQDENYLTISKTLKKDPDASTSTCDPQPENTSTIKTEFDEHEFKNFSIEEENFGSNEDITEDRFCG